jgi:hypothetical protein
VDRNITHPDFPGGEVVGRGDHIDQRGLAGAGFSEDADQLTGENVKINPPQSQKLARGGFIGLADAVYSNERFTRFEIRNPAVMEVGPGRSQINNSIADWRFESIDQEEMESERKGSLGSG